MLDFFPIRYCIPYTLRIDRQSHEWTVFVVIRGVVDHHWLQCVLYNELRGFNKDMFALLVSE